MDSEFSEYLNPRYIVCAMLESQFIDLDNLIRWSDHFIEMANTPAEWLFSISLGTNYNDVVYSMRMSLIEDELLDENLIDTLFIGLSYLSYKDEKISLTELDKKLVGYFVGNKPLFNEDDLSFYFLNLDSNSELIRAINAEFKKAEHISKIAIQYFYSNSIIDAIK